MGNSESQVSKEAIDKATAVPAADDAVEQQFFKVKVGHVSDAEVKQLEELNQEQLSKLASFNGLNPESCKTPEELISALKTVLKADFWRKNASIHPNHSRVKNWLWIHSRYRDQISGIQEKYATAGQTDPRWAENLQEAFEKFHAKIEKHSTFEDTMLFKFFKEHLAKDSEIFLQELEKQHHDLVLVETVKTNYQAFLSNRNEETVKAWTGSIDKYAADLLQHLELEERSLVHLWLNLTPEQYSTYRSYLSWEFGVMY
jgi:hemerythrin-like domain-containing protein